MSWSEDGTFCSLNYLRMWVNYWLNPTKTSKAYNGKLFNSVFLVRKAFEIIIPEILLNSLTTIGNLVSQNLNKMKTAKKKNNSEIIW